MGVQEGLWGRELGKRLVATGLKQALQVTRYMGAPAGD